MDREFHRLKAVERFKELEPGIANDLRDIVNLVSQICATPVALITLLDKDKQWFKVAKGTDVTETPRSMSFCNYTIEQDSLLIVNDMTRDERYRKNPLVTNDPNVRFYAGAPLTTKDGFNIGSLCVVDFELRDLTEHQQTALKTLSKQVINLMELNWTLHVMEQQNKQHQHHQRQVEDSQLKLKAIFDSSTDIHLLIGKDMEILAFNKPAAIDIYNVYQRELAVGDRILNYIDPKVKHHFIKYLEIALKGKVIKHELLMRAGTEFECWREIKFVPIRNNENTIIGVAINSANISKRKQQEKQISIQNEALTRIAIIQSHELRRPVASLLGMMDLMKMENVDFGYFNMMEITVNELDKKIRIIVEDSENTINRNLSIVA